MIGLDTNVIVRYIVQDDEAQAHKANALFQKLTAENPGFVSIICMVELVWVLRISYRAKPERIAEIIEQLLISSELRIEKSTLVAQALRRYRNATADFADHLIAAGNQAAGCTATVTFDRLAAKSAGMKAL